MIFLGDMSGRAGREAIKAKLPGLVEAENADFVIANGENCAGGLGITMPTALELFDYGISVITLGNHTFRKHDIASFLEREPNLLRPANYPAGDPGNGWTVTEIKGVKVGVLCLQGQVFMPPINSPFEAAMEAVTEMRRETKIIFVDVHAEATSEKAAIGRFLDGKVTAVFGTHTHVQTADECVLPCGTAFITDAGMTGVRDSILGMDIAAAMNKFFSFVPEKFALAEGEAFLEGAAVEFDPETGKAFCIKRISY